MDDSIFQKTKYGSWFTNLTWSSWPENVTNISTQGKIFDEDINRSYLAVRGLVVQAPMTIRSRELSFFYVTFERKHPVYIMNACSEMAHCLCFFQLICFLPWKLKWFLNTFSERTFIDVFCIKVSTILIKNSVLYKYFKIQGYFDQTAIF